MKRQRRIRWIVLLAVCMALLFGTIQVQAQTMKDTKGISWKLKVNKKHTYYSYWGDVGMIRQSFKITKWKDKWSGNKGMRRLSFRITFTRCKKPTAKDLIKAATYYTVYHPEVDDTSPRCYFTAVDYYDGISLEDPKNPYGVIVSSKWKKIKKTTYKTSGYGLTMSDVRVDVSIEYPYTYKGLCIGIGGMTDVLETNSDKLFWNGIYPFWMTDTLRCPAKKRIAWFGTWKYKG